MKAAVRAALSALLCLGFAGAGAALPPQVTPPATGGGGGGMSTIVTVYTASGAVSPLDDLSIVICSAACDMTLAAGSDKHRQIIKRYGAGTVTVTLTLDGGAAAVITAADATYREPIWLEYRAALATWIWE